ncbi:mitogen-activated protein kinase kinase kinase 3-like [Neltuma alba]|uniref:mitogen-activated protein kinase kinase kinase 3-like n=1 Tax=Neltuma alba TaxID=207710 RepID=UPI0010A3B6BF|nr:mitogen-activated protein kinase kinase kinase 3-like [Prosopis alba]
MCESSKKGKRKSEDETENVESEGEREVALAWGAKPEVDHKEQLASSRFPADFKMSTSCGKKKNIDNSQSLVLPSTLTVMFITSSSNSASTSYHHPISQFNSQSSSTLNGEASEWKGKKKEDIGSIVLPETSIFYGLRTVSTIIFSSSESDTNAPNSAISYDDQANNANSSASFNAQTIEVKEYTASNPSKWKRGKILGQGAFGRVYKGFNSETGQICAIKEVFYADDDDRSEKCLQQLCQEKNILSQLSHSNIVKYYGRLAYLHSRNIVHRDIKGANILVNPYGEIKLADFGMARYVNSSSKMYSFKGTLYWMAPEMVDNKNGYTIAVDIWSLGCTVLEMATQKPPWSQYKREVAIAKIGNSRDLPTIPNHLSDNAKSFIRFCLQRDPDARPPAHQLLDHPFIREY